MLPLLGIPSELAAWNFHHLWQSITRLTSDSIECCSNMLEIQKTNTEDHPSCLSPSVVRIRCKNSSESRSPHQTWQVGLENDSHTNQEYFLHPLQKVDETQLVVDDKKLATCCRSASFCNLAPYPERFQDFYLCATSQLNLLCVALDGYFIRLQNLDCGFESLR